MGISKLSIKKAGKVPIYFSGKDAWSLQLPILMSGSTLETAALIPQINVNKAKVTDMQDRRVGMQFIQDAIAKGYTNEDVLSASYDDAQKALAGGEAGMYHMATWVMNEIAGKYPDGVNDIGGFIMPFKGNGQDKAALWSPWSIYIPKGENQENAQKFVNYFEKPEIQDLFFGNNGGITAIKGVTKTKLTPAELDAKKYLDEGTAIGNIPYPPLYNFDANLANIVIVSLPVIVLYLFMQKYIIAGMTSGAIKS